MTPDEWLTIVDELEARDVKLTVDVAARMGVVLRRHSVSEVREAVDRLVAAGVSLTGPRIGKEIRNRPSKYAKVLETRHRELFPRGCPNPGCDVCLTSRPSVR